MPGERGATATGLRGALRRLRRIDEEGLEAAYDAGAYGTQYEGYTTASRTTSTSTAQV